MTNDTLHAEATRHDPEQVIAVTRDWIEKAVIGLGLCPFAPAVHWSGRTRYRVSEQRSTSGLLLELSEELQALQAADAARCETTLLIHPLVLTDFLDHNDFLDRCDDLIVALGLEGEFQVASFHPQYQFAGTQIQDIENYTNRSPYPMLHLLREASITRGADVPGVDDIGTRNIETLRKLGHEGWRRLWTV